jgi:hypothetical protein
MVEIVGQQVCATLRDMLCEGKNCLCCYICRSLRLTTVTFRGGASDNIKVNKVLHVSDLRHAGQARGLPRSMHASSRGVAVLFVKTKGWGRCLRSAKEQACGWEERMYY